MSAAVLSDRYIQDRFLPDKAIDLIDEAASPAADRERFSMPAELDAIRRRVMQLQIEVEALRKEKDPGGETDGKRPRKSWPSCRRRTRRLTARWENEKGAMDAIKKLQEELDHKQTELEQRAAAG